MTNFTPWSALAGGALIGIAALLLMGLTGRIAGISGILSGAVFGARNEKAWRIAFVLGLIVAFPLYTLVSGGPPALVSGSSVAVTVLAGLLVGFGTQLGSGCTSGHGVCGIARLSPRSLVATGVFMAAGIVTVTLVRNLFGAFA